MSKKLVISAMYEELEQSILHSSAKLIENNEIIKLYESDDILFAITGIGLVNASVGLSYVLSKYNIDQILNIGTCGSLNKTLKQQDFVIVKKAFYSCADATAFGYKYGQVPRMEEFFEHENHLFKHVKQNNRIVSQVNIASSDIFICNKQHVDLFINKIDQNIDVIDMECTGFFHTARLFEKDIVSVKVISDVLFEEKPNSLQFKDFIKKASELIWEFISEINL
ncbi:5'-methylthioadenosine/S-adenosylhomocysteine nucleosidase [Mycoplasma cottewii]|uniref:adenosylhomocysteine nucleosidase n=1 Tax=Mycoplasma cottewii TaxID=51364 RepID=A0ABY5U1M0_9MOLU|nr:5'-methylthioadenosine/S-adenosylhomocysteine nucleosidase [Mycoplasma cottewii]UWD35378.1 5'-methylthioadenosine/S-adenosylhomocysteine nucleosidase [Mycoplasma cottewii]